jgi:hypothetical protein
MATAYTHRASYLLPVISSIIITFLIISEAYHYAAPNYMTVADPSNRTV